MPRLTHIETVFLVLALGSFGSTACPLTPPAGLRGEMVSEELQINGLPTAIYQVRSIEPAERLIQDSEREWRNQGYAPRQQRFAPWLIVSAAKDGCVSVLQLKNEGGAARGFLSVSFPARSHAALDTATRKLLPEESQVESAVQSKDQGRDGITVVVTAPRSSSQWTDDLMRRLQGGKWQGVGKHTFKRPAQQLSADRVTAQLNGRQLTAIVWGGDQTQAVITLMEPL
jgi:hypothetical protein